MKSNLLMNFSVDRENNKINVEREFAAPISNVWAAWTKSELLDQWWAPKPCEARTKIMDFKESGYWLYAMIIPDGTVHWSKVEFKSIVQLKKFVSQVAFCDEDGNINLAATKSLWTNEFSERANSTIVSVELKFDQLSDLEMLVAMNFKDGFTSALENLDKLLNS